MVGAGEGGSAGVAVDEGLHCKALDVRCPVEWVRKGTAAVFPAHSWRLLCSQPSSSGASRQFAWQLTMTLSSASGLAIRDIAYFFAKKRKGFGPKSSARMKIRLSSDGRMAPAERHGLGLASRVRGACRRPSHCQHCRRRRATVAADVSERGAAQVADRDEGRSPGTRLPLLPDRCRHRTRARQIETAAGPTYVFYRRRY
jgi:hypothetical protein